MNLTMALIVVASYLVGAVPFGLLLAGLKGIDPRKVGSGNIGATNVIRAGGRGMGVATFMLDGLKGAFGPLLVWAMGGGSAWQAAAALAAILGHCFPLYLRFRGGKGVATLFGAFLAADPAAAGLAALVFAASLLVLRFVAVSSLLLAATLMLFSVWQNGVGAPLTLAAMMATVLVGYTHRSNWERMRRGVEGRAFAADPGETLDG